MSKIKRTTYFSDNKHLISEENAKLYEKYIRSNVIKNPLVKSSTYKVYQNYMNHFMTFLAVEWDNMGLYSEDFMDDAVEILESYIMKLQELGNNKKVINTKLSTISSFYLWSLKRGLIDKHPFDNKLERMKGAQDEKIIASHFLSQEEIDAIEKGLKDRTKYTVQDELLWHIAYTSAGRVGALSRLTLSSLNREDMLFEDILEKRGKLVEIIYNNRADELLDEWLEQRKEMDNLEVDALFISKHDGKWQMTTKGTLQARIKRMGNIIGIDDFRAHSIRKTRLNRIVEDGGSLELAAELANHESTDTTKKSYVKPSSKKALRARLDKLKESDQKQDDK